MIDYCLLVQFCLELLDARAMYAKRHRLCTEQRVERGRVKGGVKGGKEEQGRVKGGKGGGVKSWPFIICSAGLWGEPTHHKPVLS